VGKTWVPKLGLDLRGGTTITLTAENTDRHRSRSTPNSLQLARTIIQSAWTASGVGRVEVTTAGDRQLIVTVPNVQRDQLVELVGQTALLRFRAVYAAEQVTPAARARAAAHGVDRAVHRAARVGQRGA
jgi:preprotein translocase subunit SecD